MSSRARIFAVGRNQQNLVLLDRWLRGVGYETCSASTAEAIEQALVTGEPFGLAFIDISGFDRRIWQVCEQLSERGIPLMVISPPKMAHVRQESLEHGAKGVLYKPLVIRELMAIVQDLFQERIDE